MNRKRTKNGKIILKDKIKYPYNKRYSKCHICKSDIPGGGGILHIRPTSPSYRAIWDVVCRNEKCNYEYIKKYNCEEECINFEE